MTRSSLRSLVLGALVLACVLAAPGSAETLDPPAGENALAPRLTATEERLYLSWLEPVAGDDGEAHRLRVAWRESGGTSWSEPVTIREGDDFFANWADLPGVARDPGGTLVAWWLQMLGEGTYSYGVRLARSTDDGLTWEDAGWLHDDTSETEHGFVSVVPAEGGLRVFWLDGREMGSGGHHAAAGAMTLRTTLLRDGRPGASERLDDRTCECCDTDAAVGGDGPVVVYRDRSEKEIRDVYVVRRAAEWTNPRPVHEDGWEIAGCPVNGPAVAAGGSRVGVAWYTGADERSRVQAAFSSDGGATFAEPVPLDESRPVGRVGVAAAGENEIWVSWLGRTGEGGEVKLARVGPEGIAAGPIAVARTSAERSAGVPALAVFDGTPWVAWVDEPFGEPSRIRATRIASDQPAAATPEPDAPSSTKRR